MDEQANSYYKSYYDRMGADAYLGEKLKTSSRMLVFTEWLRSYLKPGDKVLDIGCGDMVFAGLMPEFEWYGVDINVERAKARIENHVERTTGGFLQAEKAYNETYAGSYIASDGTGGTRLVLSQHDLMNPPYRFPEKYFDAIVCSEVLEHLWDLRVVHKEAKRLLKRDGVYVISTPNFDWITNHLESYRKIMSIAENHWTFEHIRHYNFDLHKKYLNEVGFVVDRHQGADEMYCPIFQSVALGIQAGLRERGHDISTPELGVMIGKSVPFYQHTTIISARKA